MANNGSNGTGEVNKALELLLTETSPKAKASVLEWIIRFDVDVDEALFPILAALGQIEFLLKEIPQELWEIIDKHSGKLDKWTDKNLEILEKLAQKTEIEEALAKNSENLSASAIALIEVSKRLSDQLVTSNETISSSLNQLQSLPSELKKEIKEISTTIQSAIAEDERPTKNSSPSPSNGANRTQKKLSYRLWIAAGVGAFLFLAGMNLQQQQEIRSSSQRIQWLLEKANRNDCLAGIKPPQSPECSALN